MSINRACKQGILHLRLCTNGYHEACHGSATWLPARAKQQLRRQAAAADEKHLHKHKWRRPCQPHPGTQCHRYGCSLPGLTGFTVNRCEGTNRAAIENRPELDVVHILRVYQDFARVQMGVVLCCGGQAGHTTGKTLPIAQVLAGR